MDLLPDFCFSDFHGLPGLGLLSLIFAFDMCTHTSMSILDVAPKKVPKSCPTSLGLLRRLRDFKARLALCAHRRNQASRPTNRSLHPGNILYTHCSVRVSTHQRACSDGTLFAVWMEATPEFFMLC